MNHAGKHSNLNLKVMVQISTKHTRGSTCTQSIAIRGNQSAGFTQGHSQTEEAIMQIKDYNILVIVSSPHICIAAACISNNNINAELNLNISD